MLEDSELAVSTLEAAIFGGTRHRSDEKDKLWCDHCHQSCHNCYMCWNLHGRPQKKNETWGKVDLLKEKQHVSC